MPPGCCGLSSLQHCCILASNLGGERRGEEERRGQEGRGED
ncbi:hypothetical protein D4764_16G0009660, partial [Takifugu flavidus]